MNPNDRKQRRRALTRCFFFHNRTAAFLAMSAVILNIPLNLAVAWQMQQLIDIAAGSPSAFTLPKISASLALSFAVMAAIMAVVAGIMVALSVDELMPLAKEIDPNNNPSYGVLCGMSVMGFSLVLLQTAGIG